MTQPHRKTALTVRQTRSGAVPRWELFLAASFFAVGMAMPAWADSHEDIIVSHGFNEYAELKYPADFAHLDYVNPDAPIYGEISISWSGSFDSMNPYATLSGTPAVYSSVMYETLLTPTSDEVGSSYCLLCSTLEYPESQDWVIFNLRDDVLFSDGTSLTAEDVLFSYEILLEQSTPSFRQALAQLVQSAEILPGNRVKFTFREDARRRARIGQIGILPIMPKAWFDRTGQRLDEPSLEMPPGSGEYMAGTVDPGRQVVYVRNPEYWGEDVPINIGRGNYESIRIEYFTDSAAAFEAFKSGIFTFRQEVSSRIWSTGYDFPALENGWVVKNTLPNGDLPATTGFAFNMGREKLSDPRVREAIGLMYNFTWTNENLQYGLFSQRTSFWENDRLRAEGLPQGRELEMLENLRDLLDPAIFTEPAVMPHESGDRPLDRGNLRRALTLMEEAGFTNGEDGLLRDEQGNTLDVELLESSPSFDRIVLPYVENLERLGVNITYNRVDPAQYQARMQSKDFDMTYTYWVNSLTEGGGLLQRYGCEDKDDIFNRSGYCSEAVDALGAIIENAEDYDQMAAAITAVDRIMRFDRFVIFAWYGQERWLAHYDMYRHPEDLPEFGFGHMDYWWIDAEAEQELKNAGAFQ